MPAGAFDKGFSDGTDVACLSNSREGLEPGAKEVIAHHDVDRKDQDQDHEEVEQVCDSFIDGLGHQTQPEEGTREVFVSCGVHVIL